VGWAREIADQHATEKNTQPQMNADECRYVRKPSVLATALVFTRVASCGLPDNLSGTN
jgi:hypothetical protein